MSNIPRALVLWSLSCLTLLGAESPSSAPASAADARSSPQATAPAGFGTQAPRASVPADQPRARTDRNSQIGHEQLLEKARHGGIDLYFEGDSITRRWGATDYPQFLAHWKKTFFGWNAADFGWGGDTTQNILWRLEHGELDGVNPKVIVLLAGTNNIGKHPAPGADEDIAKGIRAILDVFQQKAPRAKIVLMAIFPRNDNPGANAVIRKVNERIEKFADGDRIRWLSINDQLATPDGTLHEEITVDKLHLSLRGYEIWGAALKPILTELLGPPATTDHAPPPTGDPGAKK
jgi:lysophospholipase L1-like esterase